MSTVEKYTWTLAERVLLKSLCEDYNNSTVEKCAIFNKIHFNPKVQAPPAKGKGMIAEYNSMMGSKYPFRPPKNLSEVTGFRERNILSLNDFKAFVETAAGALKIPLMPSAMVMTDLSNSIGDNVITELPETPKQKSRTINGLMTPLSPITPQILQSVAIPQKIMIASPLSSFDTTQDYRETSFPSDSDQGPPKRRRVAQSVHRQARLAPQPFFPNCLYEADVKAEITLVDIEANILPSDFRAEDAKPPRRNSSQEESSLRFKEVEIPELAFRGFSSASQGVNTSNGFKAGAFKDVLVVPSAPSTNSPCYKEAAKRHLEKDKSRSTPFVSVIKRQVRLEVKSRYSLILNISPVRAIRRAAILSEKSDAFLAMIDTKRLIEKGQIQAAQNLRLKLCPGVFATKDEFLIWGEIGEEMIVNVIPMNNLLEFPPFISQDTDVFAIKLMSEYRPRGYGWDLRLIIKEKRLQCSYEMGLAIGHLIKILGLDISFLNSAADLIIEDWEISKQNGQPSCMTEEGFYDGILVGFRDGQQKNVDTDTSSDMISNASTLVDDSMKGAQYEAADSIARLRDFEAESDGPAEGEGKQIIDQQHRSGSMTERRASKNKDFLSDLPRCYEQEIIEDDPQRHQSRMLYRRTYLGLEMMFVDDGMLAPDPLFGPDICSMRDRT